MKGLVCLLTASVLLLSTAGCATMNKKNDTEIQSLKTQVTQLEAKVQQKDSEIDALRQSLSRTTEEKYAQAKESSELSTSVPTPRQIQKALKNAGFEPGELDGKLGRTTRKAIRDFQKAHHLSVDGKVGPKTWLALEKYEKK
ncbi:MAG: peptidoglycan-binding domain-containing protein [Deltaproteobacteria bacterium]